LYKKIACLCSSVIDLHKMPPHTAPHDGNPHTLERLRINFHQEG
jgi:hypothetical protein